MAEEDIEIRFVSSRQGTGGEETIDELDDVKQRMDALSRSRRERMELGQQEGEQIDDLSQRRSRQNEEDEAAYNEETRRIRGRIARYGGYAVAVGATLRSVSEEVGNLIEELRQVDPVAAEQFKGIEELAKSIESPVSSALGKALNFASGDPREAIEGLKQSIEFGVKVRQDLAKMILETGRQEIEALSAQADALRFANELANQQRQTDSALENVQDAERVQDGTPSGIVEASRVVKDIDAEVAALDASLEPRLADIETMRADIVNQQENLRNLIYVLGADSPAVEEATSKLKSAQESYYNVINAFDQAEQLVNERINTVLAQGVESFQAADQDVQQRLANEAERLASSIEEAAAQQGGQISEYAKRAMESLIEIVKDARVSPDEIQRYRAAIADITRTNEATLSEVASAMESSSEVLNAYQIEFQSIRREIDRLRTQLEGLR